MTPSPGRPRGFALIELIVVATILGIVVALCSSLFASGTRVLSRETTAVELQGDLAAAKNVFLDDATIAGYRPDAAGPAFENVDLATSAVEILGDVDSDGASDRVCYRLSADTLQRSQQAAGAACGVGGWQVLAADVASFDLTFWDAVTPRTTPLTAAQVAADQARYVQIRMVVQAPAKGGPVRKLLFGEAAIRN